jgi:hypothetical protein
MSLQRAFKTHDAARQSVLQGPIRRQPRHDVSV